MKKEYALYSSKPKTVKVNNLVPAKRESGVYFDFSILDNIKFNEPWEREMIEEDIIKFNECCWYSQPMPTIIIHSALVHYTGQVRTAYTRVFRKNGNRMMVIVEVTKIHIERQRYKDHYSLPETEYAYDAESGYRFGDQGDEEVA